MSVEQFAKQISQQGSQLSLRPGSAAKQLGVCERTLRGWIAAGHVRSVKVGNVVLISRTELDRFLAEGPAISTLSKEIRL